MANFCTQCGSKIVDVCDCWILHKKFQCKLGRCPKNTLERMELSYENGGLPEQTIKFWREKLGSPLNPSKIPKSKIQL